MLHQKNLAGLYVGAENGAWGEVFDDPVMDRGELLGRVEGDQQLLIDLVAAFRQTAPDYLSTIDRALECRELDLVRRTAHTIKGSVGALSARAAFDAAEHLETVGRAGDLDGAREARHTLGRELERLQSALTQLTQEAD